MKKVASDKIVNSYSGGDLKSPHPPELPEFYQRLLKVQAETKALINSPGIEMDKDVLNSQMVNGTPLLKFDDLNLDWALVEDTFIKIGSVFAAFPELFNNVPEWLPGQKPKLFKEAIKAWFNGDKLSAEIVSYYTDEHLLAAIIHQTIKPFLASHAQELIGEVNQELWQRDYCPVCGGISDFAFLEKEAGARWLLCSNCDTQWLFQRLTCPYCGNNDHKSLSYFVGDSERYRLYVCDKCHCYLKAIDLRKVEDTADIILPLERFMTIDMEHQGQEKGYNPGGKRMQDI